MKHTYTTVQGKALTITPSSPYQIENYRLSFIEQYEKENPPVERPTYRTETAGGGFEILPHDETTVQTDEEKAAWEAYAGHERGRDNFVNTKILDVLIVENLDVDPATDKAWLAKKTYFKVDLPHNDIELKLFYVKEHLVFNEEDGGDFNKLPLAIMQLSGISQRAVAAGKATFRNTLRQRRGKVTRPTAVETDGEQVVDEPEISGDEDGEGVALDAE